MTLRSGHGAMKDRGPRVEVLPPDEQPAATAPTTVPTDRGQDGRFTAGNAASRARRFKVSRRGFTGLDKADPRYKTFARFGRSYAAHRRREIAAAHGGTISAGVGAMVESAALAMAASRFVSCLAAESGDPLLFKQASALANDARQNELAAWELAARECKARIANAPPPDVAALLAAGMKRS